MRLQREQVFPQARIRKVNFALGEETKVTLEIETALTEEVASNFGCHDLIFAGSVPRSGIERMVLEGSELNTDIHLKHEEFAFQTVVEEMGHYVARFEGTGPKLRFQVKFTGFVITIADLIEHVKVDPLEITLKPAQQELDLQNAPPEEDVEGEPGDDSERLISTEQAEDTKEADDDGPALASVVEMGGSHQRGTRKRQKMRQPQPEPEPAPPAEGGDDFMNELVGGGPTVQ